MTEQEKRDFFVAPVFHKPLQDLSTSQGECVVLECRVKGVPPPVLTWRREGDVIDDCPDFRILHRGEIATLVIGEAFPEDTGHFTCEAVNKAGEAVTSCKLAVRSSGHHSVVSKSPAPPQTFLRPVQVLPAHNNSDENHNFKAEKDQLVQQVSQTVTSPTPKQTKQLEVTTDGDYILYSPTLAAILEIEPQEYKVSNFEQRLMNEIEYRLERSPPVVEDPADGVYEDVPVEQQKAPVFTTVLKNFKAMDGTSTKFVCRVTAKPPAKIFWFKDGKQISKRSQHYIHHSHNDGSHELSIPHLCMEDDGNYTALATNPQGRVSSSGRLAMVSEKNMSVANDVGNPDRAIVRQSPISPPPRRVRPPVSLTSPQLKPHELPSPPTPVNAAPPEVMPEKGQLAADEESPIEKYYRPNFIQKPPAEINADEGKLVRFDVKVTGLPLPGIEWFINGRPVRQDSLHKILVRENNVHSLLLERASPMDEGQYTIVATNKAGSSTVNIQLHVAAREFTTPPAFVQRLSAQCVAEGDPVRLEARVVATPRPIITWKKGSDQILHDHRTQLYQDDSGYVCLQISNASLQDAAWYSCSATNKAGISSCNCKLDVYSQLSNAPTTKRRIRTPHRYANLAKVAGVDMREALTPDAQLHHHILPESEEL